MGNQKTKRVYLSEEGVDIMSMSSKYILDTAKESFQDIQKLYRDLKEELSEESIHDFRVSVRKTISIVSIARFVLKRRKRKNSKLESGYLELKDYFKTFSELRDTQVQIIYAKDVLRLEGYVAELKKREKQLKKMISSEIREWNVEKTCASLLKGIEKVVSGMKDGELESCSLDRTVWLKENILRDIENLDKDSRSYHRLRLSLKKYRYHLELTELGGKTDRELKFYQDKLGQIQDLSVLLRSLKKSDEIRKSTEKKIKESIREEMREFKQEHRENIKGIVESRNQ